MFWKYLVALLIGVVVGYYVKDNAAKPDVNTDVDVDLKVKRNRLGTIRKKGLFKRFRKKRRKKDE